MSTWEKRFASRMNALHHTSSGNFEDLVKAEIQPVFDSVKPFITSGGFSAEAMKGCENIRHYRFSLSKDMYIDLYFTRKGPCEVSSTFQLHDPFAKRRDAVMMETIPLADVTEGWARQQFEVCLDEFLGEVEAMIGTGLPVVLDANASNSPGEPALDKPQPAVATPGDQPEQTDPQVATVPNPASTDGPPTPKATEAPAATPVSPPTPVPAPAPPPTPTPPQKQDPGQVAA